MPTAMLAFKLPEERYEHGWAVDAPKMVSVLGEFDEWLRRQIKDGHPEAEALQRVRDHLNEELADRGLNIHEG